VIRDLGRLARTEFDLLVIGGGIHGLAVAYDAALRGLSVALVERDDFGGASSFNHLRTVHGGLRSLQTASLRQAREAIRERRTFARIAPACVRPLGFVVPTGGAAGRHAVMLRLAFLIDAGLGFDRNAGVPEALRLPAGDVISRDACRRLFGDAWRPDASGGARWHDYQMHRAERITMGFALGAAGAGACLANYVDAREPLRTGDAVSGVMAVDRIGNERFEVRARVTLNAAGGGAGPVMEAFGVKRSIPVQKALNLVVDRDPPPLALGAPAPGGGTLFLVPWRGRTVAGTWHLPDRASASDTDATERDVDSTLQAVNAAFPSVNVTRDRVRLVHRGLVPGIVRGNGDVSMRNASDVVDHRRDGVPALVSIVGVKYTTARAVAERATDLVCEILGRASVQCRTAEQRLPGGDIAPPDELVASAPLLEAAVERAIHDEMALTLSDVVLRRTAIGSAGYPGGDAVARCARAAQRALGWDEPRTAREVDELKRSYAPVRV
jgi:glycerol-3-phosphate dehydrogenase